ncbi:MAG: hypothetical protein MJ252_26275 [archaeon]|nr:hypothetical protein [archaeon]
MEDLIKKYSIDSDQVEAFKLGYKIIEHLSKADQNIERMNCPFDLDLKSILKHNKCNEKTTLALLTNYLNTFDLERTVKFSMDIKSDEDADFYEKLLSQVENCTKFHYKLLRKVQPDLMMKHLGLFKYMHRFMKSSQSMFTDIYKEIIKEKKEIPFLYYINLDKMDFDSVLEYCKLFPNRIVKLDFYKEIPDEKLKELADLNKDSLISTCGTKLYLFDNCKNINSLTFNSGIIKEDTFGNMDLTKIEKIYALNSVDTSKDIPDVTPYLGQLSAKDLLKISEKYSPNLDENEFKGYQFQGLQLLSIINKFPNLKVLSFSTYCNFSEVMFEILFNGLSTPKLRVIEVTAENMQNEELNLEPLLTKCPLLSKFRLEEHASMEYSYGLKPCVSIDRTHFDLPSIRKILSNYLKERKYHLLNMDLASEAKEVYDCLKEDPEIMKGISSIKFGEEEDPTQVQIPFMRKVKIPEIPCSVNSASFGEIKASAYNDDLLGIITKIKPTVLMCSDDNAKEFLTGLPEKCPEINLILLKSKAVFMK